MQLAFKIARADQIVETENTCVQEAVQQQHS